MTAHPSFELLHNQSIPSLRIELQVFRHRATGARHLHMAADDPHNVFLVAFLTVPQDSTGVAHILEHTALCGSRRYPVRDPFFMMSRRSLNTFMNAFTGSDWTAYPFASQNKKDFNNLLDVYLDAVFFPRLHELDFAQEGHRLEFVEPDNPASELVFKGVVFNEMKGVLSSPVSRVNESLQSLLFPSTTYHYNSGGDPACIPQLTHTQLKDFHARHYHPSNALFMTYGDIPAAEHQQRFETQALQQFQSQTLDFSIPDEQRYTAPVQQHAYYPLEPGEDTQGTGDKTHIVLGWLLGRNTDPRAVMEAQILSDVLLDNSSSPLRHALETCGLGSAPSPLCGFDDNSRETTFVCGLEGSSPDHAEAIEQLIFTTLEQIAEHGVPLPVLESVLHQIELSQREITGDGYPYGLSLILQALTPAIHSGDPVSALDQDELLAELRQDIQNPNFIKGLTRRLLLDNPHRVRLVMEPDATLGQREAETERAWLSQIKAQLSAAERDHIVQQAQALQERQSQLDDPELLPRVEVADVPTDLHIAEGYHQALGTTPATWYAQGTNGMVYEQCIIELPDLTPEQRELLPIYTLCLSEVGLGEQDYLAVQARQAAVTGGLGAHSVVRSRLHDTQQVQGAVVLAGKALARHQAALAELMVAMLASPRFDEQGRIRELLGQLLAQRESSVTRAGHSLAMTAASAAFSPVSNLSHNWDGLLGLQRLRNLVSQLRDPGQLEKFCADLAAIHQHILAAPRELLVVSEGELHDDIARQQQAHWDGLPVAASPPAFTLPAQNTQKKEAWVTSTQVNFCAVAFPAPAPDHADAPALYVLGEYLRNGYLHTAVREQGGAYGVSAGYNPDSGAFRMFSYRDPRCQETLDDFLHALDWLHQKQHPTRALEEAILGVIAAIDKPGSPAGEAISAFFAQRFGRTPEYRRAVRKAVLEVSQSDLLRIADRYLQAQRASYAVIGSSEALQALPDWTLLSI
ncbi:MAG: insulinase family protein [Candidatus Competibacteraceae bacterium]|nr:insulinase family protein [Candidatus Competibacteraceae bacterium]